jgi:CRISPR-associated protein Cst1
VDQVSAEAPLTATGHPLQRCGAWAVTHLARCGTPQEVTPGGLDDVVAQLVADICAAATAPKATPAYDWWKVLFALYPNSKATHSKRTGDPARLRPEIEALFAPDARDGGRAWPCTFCGAAAATVWTKSNLPLFDTNKAVNTLPPGLTGWPVCRGCRVAMWALPYGGWVTAGSVTVLSSEQEAVEREFARRNVRRARRVMHAGFDGLPAATRPEHAVLVALRRATDGLSATTLWTFKNDNQEPWLRVTRTRRAVSLFLVTVDGNAPLRRGWHLLCRALTRRDARGQVTADGTGEAARSLFEAEDGRSRSLLREVHTLLQPDRYWSPGDRDSLYRLAATYAEEVLGMTTNLTPVATLVADWIQQGSSRGRFAEYKNVALSDYRLGMLLIQASARLQFDGKARELPGPEDWAPLIARRPRAWEQRMLLFAEVSVLLQQRGVRVSDKDPDPEQERHNEDAVDRPPFDDRDRDDDDYDPMGPA